jgi:Cof subfamily protein (haloacid dehalogenase superfamily)
MIELLALDLDGTLLNSRGQVPPENRAAIRDAEEAGVLVTIATGRRFLDARQLGIDLELNAPLITHNGALLKYADSLETVAASLLPLETTREVVRVGKQFGGNALVSADPHSKGTMLYDCEPTESIPLRRYLEWSVRQHRDDVNEAVIRVDDLQDALPDHEVIHISFSGQYGAMEKMLDLLHDELSERVTILPTKYPRLDFILIDILPPDASKGTGVEKLAAARSIAPEEVMAIGDNFNDIHMLEFAGTGVVMGNADEQLLNRPEFYKTDTNDESGVAAAIRRFIFKEEN